MNSKIEAPLADLPYARELPTRFLRLRFASDVEREFTAFHLRRARGRIRAWHAMVLAVLLVSVLPVMFGAHLGGAVESADAWDPGNGRLVFWAAILSTASRAALAAIAWSPWFERCYPRVALPLVVVCHAAWAYMCSGEILGAHPEYLAALVTDAFAAYFFSGLLVRQAVVVTVIAVGSLLLGAWHQTGSVVPILFYAMHLFLNMIMAAVAGFAHERSVRNLFLEHSLLGETAARDGLTGLKNRRAFDEHLERVWQQALRDGKPLGILMIDVDEFKHYNDCYGHQAGDQALVRIADAVKDLAARPLDLGARYGGEELALILYGATRDYALAAAERLHAAVLALDLEHRDAPAGTVTVSIGVALVRPRAYRRPEGAVQLADQALYAAKRAGRNRIEVLQHEYDALSTGVFRAVAAGG